MIGLTQTVQLVIAAKVTVRGVVTADWKNATLVDVKAHVYYESTGVTQGSGPGLTFTKELTALMEVVDFEMGFTRIRWEDHDYTPGPPELRYRYDKPIFQAVKLQGRA
ncbi:MAG: hypothetical protein ACTIBG_02320 [Brevibacterium aurantiacum]|uniref:hypothetical protein n=1 Tax=Brevibacterium aurantiacum TaxID=273384 RepID=UPI003F8E2158